MSKSIHIISYTVPLPANNGGVIDVFYKIKTLHSLGWKITLHCFVYNREPNPELNKFCETVYYYKRKMRGATMLSKLPFIVVSRKSEDLVQNLLKDDAPVLFEGLHTCFHIGDARLKNRTKILRAHNIEHEYYNGLAEAETSPMKKMYFNSESKKLQYFEKVVLDKASQVLAISHKEYQYFNSICSKVDLIHPFHPYSFSDYKTDKKKFALYHGNLEVPENRKAVSFLIDVFSELKEKLVVSGSNINWKLKRKIHKAPNITLVENPTDKELQNLIQTAQINVLPSFQSTGVKLKLLNALYNGGYCITTPQMVVGTGLEKLVVQAEGLTEWREFVRKQMQTDELVDYKLREKVLSNFFNVSTGELISNTIFRLTVE